ncbi:hypothetical protein EDF46_0564 [Frondihabitans sp. PhB188]|uniref:hypothetical protein n=1 Tax=Frondihabitans sp. PhB188 TaxID=2485200 RepID=UPI000F4A8734|nr:hypothetical protein [Frondihabitans sp. PhB188]ROQ41188.1 hypothetical protein EDF46_0564 [Frondihabitans sp. PhB188]
MRRRLPAALTAAALVAVLAGCAPSVGTLTPLGDSGSQAGTGTGGSTSAPQPQVTGGTGSGGSSSSSVDPQTLAPGGTLLNQVNYKDLTIYVYRVGEITTSAKSIYARPDGTDPYPAGTKVEVTAYVLVNDSNQRLDLTDLSADYSSYGNKLATQDTFAGQDLLEKDGYSTDLGSQFPAGSSTWYLLPGKGVVFANAWFHRTSDGPLTLQFLWPSERIFLGANITF